MIETLWWMEDANCKGLHKVWFKISMPEAKFICKTCPVMDVCLFYGMSFEQQGDRHYVYGGATSGQRDSLGYDQELARLYYLEMVDWYRAQRSGTPLVGQQEAPSSTAEQEIE